MILCRLFAASSLVNRISRISLDFDSSLTANLLMMQNIIVKGGAVLRTWETVLTGFVIRAIHRG
jgi:hypothetical protein